MQLAHHGGFVENAPGRRDFAMRRGVAMEPRAITQTSATGTMPLQASEVRAAGMASRTERTSTPGAVRSNHGNREVNQGTSRKNGRELSSPVRMRASANHSIGSSLSAQAGIRGATIKNGVRKNGAETSVSPNQRRAMPCRSRILVCRSGVGSSTRTRLVPAFEFSAQRQHRPFLGGVDAADGSARGRVSVTRRCRDTRYSCRWRRGRTRT